MVAMDANEMVAFTTHIVQIERPEWTINKFV